MAFSAAWCIDGAECVRGLPAVFEPQARPWTQPDKASADARVSVVARCPPGALQAIHDDGLTADVVSAGNGFHAVADGPQQLRGDIDIRDDGRTILADKTRLALCRCGACGNKPQCNNSHSSNGFRSQQAAEIPPRHEVRSSSCRDHVTTRFH
jgi:uncharacterized Fe-S cluster protein YjdI/CDGSH-type Zn-finger protein